MLAPTRTRRALASAGVAAVALGVLGWGSAGASTPPSTDPTTDSTPASASGTTGGGTTLYSVDLASGAATEIGQVGDGLNLTGLAIAQGAALGDVYGLTDAGELATFDAGSPAEATVVPITGLGPDAPLLGIDVRPADGSIVGLSTSGIVYSLTADGVATPVGEAVAPAIESPSFGWDFNPTVDRIRVDVSTGQNLRLNPDTGAIGINPDTGLPTVDGSLAFAEGDANAGTDPQVVGAAYTNSVADAEETQLYAVDAATGSLAIQDPPNDGVLNTVGELGVELTEATSFDIAPTGEALLAVPAGSAMAASGMTDGTTLYSVDLASGAATEVGQVGDGLSLVGLAIAQGDSLGSVYGLTDAGELATFDAASPADATVVPISGLGPDAPLLGIDVRPADGSIVALSTGGVVYSITADGAVTAVGEGIDPTIESPAFGWDFNPTVDRIRVDVLTGQNLRLNPDTGAVGTNPDTGMPTIDGNLAYAAGDANFRNDPQVVGAAYTNSVADAEATQLYAVDAATGSLAIQDPPNDGVLNTVGELGVELTEATSFDIAPTGEALLAVPADAFGAGA